MKDPKKEKNNRKTGGNYEQAAGFIWNSMAIRSYSTIIAAA